MRVRTLVSVMVALFAGASAAFALFGLGSEDTRAIHPDLIDVRQDPIGPGAERSQGAPATLSLLPFPALLPSANDSSADVKSSWIRTDVEPAVALELATGVLITERLAEAIDFPTDIYYKRLGEGLPGASIDTINGAPALLIQSSFEIGNPSSVDVILQGVHVSVIGSAGQDVKELVSLVETLPATGPGSPIEV